MKMAFEIFDPRGFLFLVLFAIPMVASRNIDCHGRGFHCVNSTHFMICVDLGIGISTTIDDFIIPCPLTTVCDESNIFECEFPKYEVTVPPLQVIGVTERSVTSEATVVSTSATSVPLVEVSSVTNKPVSISSIPEEVTPAPELEVLRSLNDFKEAYNETSTTAEVTVQTTPSSVLSEKATVGSVATIPDTVNSNSDSKAETTFDTAVTVSISNNTTTFANEILDTTLSTPAPTVNAGSAVDNSYRTDNSIINQNSDNNALHQNDTGLKLIGESTTTEKIEMSSTSALPSMTETKFTMTGENETKTAEVTSRHDNDEASSNVNDTPKSTIAPMNYLRTTGKLLDSNPILNTDTAIVDKIVPSSTSTTLNPSIDFTNVPYLKFAISKTIVNVTTNAANNDTSSTTVSFNISGVVENHAFVNNGLTTPSFKNDVPQPIATKNIQGVDVFDNPQEVMVRNTFQYNVPNENKIERKNDASKRIPDNLVQDKVNLTTINIENIANSNETIEIQTRNSVSNAIESLQPTEFTNSISNTVESQESKTTTLTSNVDTNNLTSTNLENLLTNIATRGRTIENVTDVNQGIINNNNVSRTDSKIENNISRQQDLSENNKTILFTNPSETNRRNRILEMPKQIKNTVEEINKNELTDSSLTYTETVSEVINSSMNANSTKVPDLNTTIDQDEFINKTYNLIDTDNNIASLEPTVIVNVGEITIPTPISKTTNTSEDLPLNSAPTQTSLNDTLPLNITGKTVLREKTDNAIVKQYTQEVKTIIENMPEVPIPNNVTDENTQIDSINVLKANESDTTFDNITSSISTLTTTTPSTILIDTTLTPVPTNVIQTGLNEITTISPATILDATANSTSESTLEPVNTTDATQITVLRESIPAEKNQTNDPNGPLETNVDFNKTKSGDDLTRAPQLIIQQTEPTLQFESITSSPSATTVPEIQSVTEFTVTNSSKGLVENLTLTQGNDTTTTGDSILTAESEVINTVENVATNVNENNSSYVRNGEVLATEVSVESTTSSTNSSIISITQNQREEATSTVATSQTQTTHSPFQLEPTDVVPEIKETNETRSIILRDGFNSTVTQDPRTNTTIVKRIIVDDTTGIEAPIINQDREILPSTPNQETKTLRSVASTSAPIASTKENVTFNLRDDKANNLTNSENNITIVKQEIFLPFQDIMGDNPPMAKTTPIMNYEEVKLENVNSNVQLPQQPPIKQIPERNNFVYGISNLSPVVAFLTPTVKLSDASFIYIIPSVRRTDEPLDQSSNHIFNHLPFNKVTTQPVLNSVTAPDSMVETIPVNGAKIIEKSHLGLVLNDTRVKNLTVDSNYGRATAKHIDIEKIENVTTTAINLTELHDIDQNINKEKALMLNDGNMNFNITKEILSNKEIASNYRKLIPDIQGTGLSTESPVNLPQNSLNNTAENEKMSTITNMAHVSSQKESRETLKPANNNYVNLENNNVTFVKTSITNISQDFETPNKLKTSTTLNNQEVNLEEHNQTQRNVTGNELKHNTTIKPDFEQTVTNKQLHESNKDKNNANATATTFNCSNHTRGKYADKKDCRKFYTCVGNLQPLVGICPNNTVFSDINKQCTRNLSHCVRNNQFRCSLEGRFKDFFKDNIYYICVKNTKKQFIRYKFQCNSDYHLNMVSIKCEKNAKNSTQSASSVSDNSRVATDESRSAIVGELSKKKYNTQFECEDEGSFSHSNDCNKYYECTKVNEVYRRKLKKCGSYEVYDKDKKKCIKSDSTEC